jgi:hypothetical protein
MLWVERRSGCFYEHWEEIEDDDLYTEIVINRYRGGRFYGREDGLIG